MTHRAREKAGLDVEGEEPLLDAGGVDALFGPLFQELPRERLPSVCVVDWLGSSRQVERVFVVGARERVHREHAIATKITLLR